MIPGTEVGKGDEVDLVYLLSNHPYSLFDII